MTPPPPPNLADGLLEVADSLQQDNLMQAQSQAQALLEEYPSSAAVHALLGDIAMADRQYREAVEWYQLSLRLAEDRVVQRKLVTAEQALENAGEVAGSNGYLDDEEAENRRERKLLVSVLVGGVLVVVGLIVVLMVTLSPRRSLKNSGPSRSMQRPAGRPMATRSTPASSARPADARPGRGQPAPVTRVEPAAPAEPMKVAGAVQMTQRLEGPLTDRDRWLTRSLAALTWPTGGEIGGNVQAILDPFTGYVMISAQLPPGRSPSEYYQLSLTMAHLLALGAIRADEGVSSLTVRILAGLENQSRQQTVVVAFRGNTNRQTLEYYAKQSGSPDLNTIWQGVFAATWWNPELRAEQ